MTTRSEEVRPGLRRREMAVCHPPVDYVCTRCETIVPDPDQPCQQCHPPAAPKADGPPSLVELARTRGGMTAADVLAECEARGLSRKTGTNNVWAVKQAGLLVGDDA